MTSGGQDPDRARSARGAGRARSVMPRHTGNGRRRPRRRDVVLAALAVLLAATLAGHRVVPDVAGVGTALDSVLPWLGVLLVPLLVVVLLSGARYAGVSLLVPALVWAGMFGTAFLPGRGGGGTQLRVVTQNLSADNPDPARTARQLVDTRADLVAVQELNAASVVSVLDAAYAHHVRVGTVGLWSRYPLYQKTTVDLGLGWDRGLRVEVSTDAGMVCVYVVHLASVRPGVDAQRDHTMTDLARSVRADHARRLLLMGDLNTASTDRQLDNLMPPLHDAQRAAGIGLGFTWPAPFPLVRPDQLLYRGLTATSAGVEHTTGSDHRAAEAGFAID